MNAKNMKISGLIKQRNYIKELMKQVSKNIEDGNPTVIYSGTVYPENVIYFEELGWNMTRYISEDIVAQNDGYPINIFEPKEDIKLSELELELSEQLSESFDKGKASLIMLFKGIEELINEFELRIEDDEWDVDDIWEEIKRRTKEDE